MNYKNISLSTIFVMLSLVIFAQNITDENGKKQGQWVEKDGMGRIKYEGQFKDDIPYGTFTYYYSNGKVKAISEIFDKGQSSYTKTFHKNGNLLTEGKYTDRKKDSVWNYYSDKQNKLLIAVEVYKNHKKNGVWKNYYGNGVIAEEKTYKDGIEHGLWKQYYDNGQIKHKVDMKNGLKEGLFTAWYPEGVVSVSGTYKKGLKEGIWMYFNDKAEKTKSELYENGIMVEASVFIDNEEY